MQLTGFITRYQGAAYSPAYCLACVFYGLTLTFQVQTGQSFSPVKKGRFASSDSSLEYFCPCLWLSGLQR